MPFSSPILFATGNKHKFVEAQAILEQEKIQIEQYPHRPVEIQVEALEEIAQHCCEQVVLQVKRPVFVEDAGMFIHHLNGFPGPYSSYVLHTLGNAGILTLMNAIDDRRAVFRSAIAFATPAQPCLIFLGETHGTIAEDIRGKEWGFGFDPIFIPLEGDGRTYAEMRNEKNKISHRAKALRKLASFLLGES